MFSKKTTNKPQDKIRYYFAHVYLPRMLFEFPQKMYENLADRKANDFILYLWNKAAKEIASKMPPSGLRLFGEKLDPTHEVFTVQMPKPQVVPEAFYGAAVFGIEYFTVVPKVVTVQYFTLEFGQNPYEPSEEYHFCEWSTLNEHRNYGSLSQNNMKLFIQAISSKVKS